VSRGAAAPIDNPTAGDVLVSNHSFEDGLDGWTPDCADVASATSAVSRTGLLSLEISGTRSCVSPTVASAPVPVVADHGYVAYAYAEVISGVAQISVQFKDESGVIVAHEATRARSTSTAAENPWQLVQVSASAPTGAVSAQVVLGTAPVGVAYFDDVLMTPDLTDLGPLYTAPGLLQGTDFGVDPQGRNVAYSVVAGSETQEAQLIATDVETGALTLNLSLPDAYWSPSGLTVATDGRVYISGIDHFYQYTVGDPAVVDLGSPGAGYQRIFDPTPGPDGSVYAGSYSSGLLFTYKPGEGFSQIGDLPVYPGQQYVRSVGYDPALDLVYAGTGTEAHIVACPGDGDGSCTSILPAQYSSASWVYYLSAVDGLVFARITGGGYTNHLVVLSVTKDVGGEIVSSVVYERDGAHAQQSNRPIHRQAGICPSGGHDRPGWRHLPRHLPQRRDSSLRPETAGVRGQPA
jgi:hypothetical protein